MWMNKFLQKLQNVETQIGMMDGYEFEKPGTCLVRHFTAETKLLPLNDLPPQKNSFQKK